MNPPAAIDTLFNRIARRDARKAVPVVDDPDMALSPLESQVEGRFLDTLHFLAPSARSKSITPFGSVSRGTYYAGGRACRLFSVRCKSLAWRTWTSTKLSALSSSS